MRLIVLALCGSLLGTLTLAAGTATNARWQTVAYSEEEEWASVPTSVTAVTSDGGEIVISVDGRMRSTKTGHTDLVRWAVTLADCRSESGKLTTCCVPCDHVPIRSWPLFKARDVMRGVIESFKEEKTQ